ncbi:MAG: rhodanese [Candidatus Dadabacteria bacterium]|nr:MAG: rhodanese [Candidatus Dadabacteria bacterium]
MQRKAACLIVSALVFSFTGVKSYAETPPHIDGAKTVTAEEAYKLQKEGATIIDARKKIEYAESHIKGAVLVSYMGRTENKPDFELGHYKELEQKFPDKNAKYVFYCNGVKCWKSFKAVKEAVHMGYKHVYWLRTGLPAWKEAGYPVE